MDHNNTDMKIADMLTRYVEELEKKVDQIEYKIKLQHLKKYLTFTPLIMHST